jgi:hypothetical protein
LFVAQYAAGLTPSDFNAAAADVNCSAAVDILDALKIAQYVAGLISSLNCQRLQAAAIQYR